MRNGAKEKTLAEIMILILLSQKFSQRDVGAMTKTSTTTIRDILKGKTRKSKVAWQTLRELYNLLHQYGSN